MKKIWALAAPSLLLVLFSCGDTGTNVGGGGENSGGGSGKYTLTTNVSPAGAGTVSPASASYDPGTQATVTAIPASGYTFSRWSGASTSTNYQITVTMNGDKTLTAVFEKLPASAVIITLTSWETRATDLFDSKLDPRIHFEVMSYQGSTQVSKNTTSYLLDAENIGQSWNGYAKSGAIAFTGSADEVHIYAVVKEKDLGVEIDDISPKTYVVFRLPRPIGTTGTYTLGTSASNESRVTFDYEFVR